MHTKELIEQKIMDIFVWSKMEPGGLDEAEVSIQLGDDSTVGIPWDFDCKDLKQPLKKGAESLFTGERITYSKQLRPQDPKTVSTKKTLLHSMVGQLKRMLFPGSIHSLLKGQEIVDILLFHNADLPGCLELQNGCIITETFVSPHGTGRAGLNLYQNLSEFEETHGTGYKRATQVL